MELHAEMSGTSLPYSARHSFFSMDRGFYELRCSLNFKEMFFVMIATTQSGVNRAAVVFGIYPVDASRFTSQKLEVKPTIYCNILNEWLF